MPKNYTVLDFETSGLSPKTDRIVEVGVCTVVDSKVATIGSWIVKQPILISAANAAIHGITTERMRQEGIPPAESLCRILDIIRSAPILVGHNFHRFDAHFLTAACERARYRRPYLGGLQDTAAIYKGHKLRIKKRSTETHAVYAGRVLAIPMTGMKFSIETCIAEMDLGALVRAGKTQNDKLHSARGDAYATHLIYQWLARAKII